MTGAPKELSLLDASRNAGHLGRLTRRLVLLGLLDALRCQPDQGLTFFLGVMDEDDSKEVVRC